MAKVSLDKSEFVKLDEGWKEAALAGGLAASSMVPGNAGWFSKGQQETQKLPDWVSNPNTPATATEEAQVGAIGTEKPNARRDRMFQREVAIMNARKELATRICNEAGVPVNVNLVHSIPTDFYEDPDTGLLYVRVVIPQAEYYSTLAKLKQQQ